jgi:hypothetical protein
LNCAAVGCTCGCGSFIGQRPVRAGRCAPTAPMVVTPPARRSPSPGRERLVSGGPRPWLQEGHPERRTYVIGITSSPRPSRPSFLLDQFVAAATAAQWPRRHIAAITPLPWGSCFPCASQRQVAGSSRTGDQS